MAVGNSTTIKLTTETFCMCRATLRCYGQVFYIWVDRSKLTYIYIALTMVVEVKHF